MNDLSYRQPHYITYLRATLALVIGLSFSALFAQSPQRSFLFDLGPDDRTNGNATVSPDAGGRHWNNLTAPGNTAAAFDIVDAEGAATGFRVSATGELRSNGLRHGGLVDPAAAELGELAVATATQDYFFTTTSGGVVLTGLDPSRSYAVTHFGSRDTEETRVTKLTVAGASEVSGTLQTSGKDVGRAGNNGNRGEVLTLAPTFPTPAGQLSLTIERAEGAFAYINLLRVDEMAGGSQTDVTAVTVVPAAITANAATVALEAEVSPPDATFGGVTWSVGDVTVATVLPGGELIPKKNGAVTVTATTVQPGSDVSGSAEVAISGQDIATYLIDFGPAGGDDGAATAGTDANGNAWTNVTATDGTAVALTDASGTSEGATVTLTGMRTKGIRDGGNLSPETSLLGELAVATATQDYAFTDPSFSGRLTLRGLDEANVYRFFVYGARDTGEVAETRYTFRGEDRSVGTLQTSGEGAGGANLNEGNVYTSELVRPNASGEIVVQIQVASGSFAYLNALQMVEHRDVGVCPVRNDRKVVFMGSSVARGQGAPGDRGYAFQVGEAIASQGFDYANISVGGNRTTSLLSRYDRDLLPECGGYVVYGLSLANEGIRSGGQATYEQFRDNLDSLARRARLDGLQPVIVSNYSRGDYSATEYGFIKDINIEIAQWPYPSVNVLGALDNGGGRWPAGFQDDVGHPNLAGHTEFFYSFVPSLFEALEEGKPEPERAASPGVLLSAVGTIEGFDAIEEYRIRDMRSFTSAFELSTSGAGTVAFVNDTFNVNSNPATSRQDAVLAVDDGGHVTYTHPTGEVVVSDAVVTDGAFHDVALTYYHANTRVDLYVDGALAGRLDASFLVDGGGPHFVFGTGLGADIRVRQWHLYRAGMNSDEIRLVALDSMLKSSLEIYAPLDPATLTDIGSGQELPNAARSTTRVGVGLPRLVGLPTPDAPARLSVAPNPVVAYATVSSREGELGVLRLYEATGRLIDVYHAGQRPSFRIATGELSPGIYYLEARGPAGRTTVPLIVAPK